MLLLLIIIAGHNFVSGGSGGHPTTVTYRRDRRAPLEQGAGGHPGAGTHQDTCEGLSCREAMAGAGRCPSPIPGRDVAAKKTASGPGTLRYIHMAQAKIPCVSLSQHSDGPRLLMPQPTVWRHPHDACQLLGQNDGEVSST